MTECAGLTGGHKGHRGSQGVTGVTRGHRGHRGHRCCGVTGVTSGSPLVSRGPACDPWSRRGHRGVTGIVVHKGVTGSTTVTGVTGITKGSQVNQGHRGVTEWQGSQRGHSFEGSQGSQPGTPGVTERGPAVTPGSQGYQGGSRGLQLGSQVGSQGGHRGSQGGHRGSQGVTSLERVISRLWLRRRLRLRAGLPPGAACRAAPAAALRRAPAVRPRCGRVARRGPYTCRAAASSKLTRTRARQPLDGGCGSSLSMRAMGQMIGRGWLGRARVRKRRCAAAGVAAAHPTAANVRRSRAAIARVPYYQFAAARGVPFCSQAATKMLAAPSPSSRPAAPRAADRSRRRRPPWETRARARGRRWPHPWPSRARCRPPTSPCARGASPRP